MGAQVEVASRFQKLEDRSTSIENRIKETQNRHATQYSQLVTKHKDLHTTVEEVRLQHRGDQLAKVELLHAQSLGRMNAASGRTSEEVQSSGVRERSESPGAAGRLSPRSDRRNRPVEPMAVSHSQRSQTPTVRSVAGSLHAPAGPGATLVSSSSQSSLNVTGYAPGQAACYRPVLQQRTPAAGFVAYQTVGGVVRR